MIKRIKIHNSNALKDPAYRFPGNYGVEKFLELFSGKLFNIYHLYGDIKSMWERLTRSVMKYFAFWHEFGKNDGKMWKIFEVDGVRVETWLVLVIILVDNCKKNSFKFGIYSIFTPIPPSLNSHNMNISFHISYFIQAPQNCETFTQKW